MDQTPETKPLRSVAEIKAEYNTVCGFAGEAQFKMKALEADLFEFNKKLVALHQEHNEAVKLEEAKKEVKDV